MSTVNRMFCYPRKVILTIGINIQDGIQVRNVRMAAMHVNGEKMVAGFAGQLYL